MNTKNTYCATIGFFDGVHLGHQHVIHTLNAMARESDMKSMVITFDRHPRQVVQPDYAPQLITPLDDKVALIADAGVDRVQVLCFSREMAQMSARDFMQTVLHDRLGVRRLLIGYDNRFGHNRTEGFEQYAEYGREMGIGVEGNTPVDIDGQRVSSSLVRRLIAEGDVEEARRCMGHCFEISGTVGHGFQEGRRLGFPTANIVPECKEQILPKRGVYAVDVSINGGGWLRAMMNVGDNPTFARNRLTLEAHIIGFDADIYGMHVRARFLRRLRDEQCFGSVEELRQQLCRDMEAAEKVCI